MRILHLSDLHYGGRSNRDSRIVIDALITFLRGEFMQSPDVDIVIFSGDLVHHGSDNNLFLEAISDLISPVMEILKLDMTRFFICPGNHDLDRDIVRRHAWVDLGLSASLTDSARINAFIDGAIGSSDYNSPPFNRLHNFYSHFWLANRSNAVFSSPFAQTYILDINGCSVGIASINTSWRATGEPNNADYGRMIVGERVVDLAAQSLTDCHLKLALFHHPTSWQHDTDQLVSRGRIQTEFDILFCGHIHASAPERKQFLIGECILSQGGALYTSRDYFNGFSVLDIDLQSGTIIFNMLEYSDVRRVFTPALRIAEGGRFEASLPQRDEGSAQIRVAKVLNRLTTAIKNLGSEHIRMTGPHGPKHDIAKHFACPVFRQTNAQDIDDDDPRHKVAPTLETILQSSANIILYGGRESGKTTLAHFMAYNASQGKIDAARIPYVCDADNLANNPNALWQLVRFYIRELDVDVIRREMVESLPALVIVDNLDPFDNTKMSHLHKLVARHSNVRWILLLSVSNAASMLVNTTSLDEFGFEKYLIGTVPRSEIRTLAANWLDTSVDSERAKKLHSDILTHLNRSSLPRSGYIISLLLWAFQQRATGETLNEAVLLRNVIDFLLGRMDYAAALRSEFDYTSKFAVLQELAYFCKRNGRSIPKNDVLRQLLAFLDRTGLRFDAAAILGGLIGCGVLSFDGANVSFRYSRFQDYFVANYLRDNATVLESVLTSEYLEFVHELDLYTATYRGEERVLDAAHNFFTAQKLPASDDLNGVDAYLFEGDQPDFARVQLKKMREEPMTAEKVDALLEAAERSYDRFQRKQVQNQKRVQTGENSELREFLLYLQGLDSYGKIARNLEFADKEVKSTHIVYCIDGWQQLLIHGLGSLRASIREIRLDPGQMGTPGRQVSRADFDKILNMAESFVKSTFPSTVAGLAGMSLGSEKVVDFIKNSAMGGEVSSLRRLLAGFILLEISPRTALDFLRQQFPPRSSERWMACAIVNRLHTFYMSNPLAAELQDDFTQYLAELDAWLVQDDNNVAKRKFIVNKIKKDLMKKKPDGDDG